VPRGDARARQLGAREVPRVVPKRGFTAERALCDWHRTALDGAVHRRHVRITLLDSDRQPTVCWILSDARLADWQGPDLDGRSSGITIESVARVHEGLAPVE
jgi:phage tail-like protein